MLGRILLTLDAVGLILGAPIADLNHTHIYNHRWKPHAKFHCAQTITLSVLLGLATLYYTWQPVLAREAAAAASSPSAAAALALAERDSLRTAVFAGSIYWLAGFAAYFFPGTDGVDPEFGTPGTFPQAKIFAAFAGLGVGGWLLESGA